MESLNTPIQSPHFQSRDGMLNHTGGAYSHSGLMNYPRVPLTEWNLGQFPDSMEFQSWKLNCRTEVCMRTAQPQVTMLWIKEVEVAKSFDDLVTSRSITVQHDFPDFDMLDAMIASALKKLINTHSTFRKRVSVEEHRAQSSDRFLRGRQIAYMIYKYFRATGAYETVQRLSHLVSMTLQNDDVQDFDVRWDHALLSVIVVPSDLILEGLFKSKLQNSAQLRTVMALYDQEVARNNGTPNYQQLKTAVELHIDQMMRNRTFKARNDVVEERGSVTKSQKGKKPVLRGKWKSVFSGRHQDNVPKETPVLSVMTIYKLLETEVVARD